MSENEAYCPQPHDMRGNEVYFDESGNPYAIDKDSGEVYTLATTYLKDGDRAYTKEAREAYRLRIERERQRKMMKKNERDRFVFANTAEKFACISPASVARLIVLSTYSDYNGCLLLSRTTPMKYENLQSILKIGRTAVQDFWKEVSPMYIIENEGNLVLTDDKTFHRGELRNTDTRWTKIYHIAVRKLYHSVDKSQHKHLGHVFRMLRYINVEHNILCLNPMEKEREHVIPITFGQFCERAGYSASQVNRLSTYFMNIKFGKEYFCGFVVKDKRISHSLIFVNPNVVYSGTDPESVANFAVLSRHQIPPV